MGAARRILRDVRPDAVLGARRLRRRPGRARRGGAARADRAGRGRQPPGPDQPPARALGAARVPGLPDRRARRRALPRHRAPGAAAGDRSRRGPRALRPGAGRHVRARVRRLAGRADDQRGGGRRRWPAPTSASCTPAGRATTTALRARLGPDPPANYDLREFITPFGEALLASDLCVARAGGSIFEVAAHGRPAILVPYPHASADHQSANARWMAQAGAAVVVPDAELTPERLAGEVRRAARRSPARLEAMGRASASLARPDAAQRIAEEVLAAAARVSASRRRRARWPHRARAPR